MSQAVHPMYVLRWLLGDVARVSCLFGDRKVVDMTAEDHAVVLLKFRSIVTRCQPGPLRLRCTIVTVEIRSRSCRLPSTENDAWTSVGEVASTVSRPLPFTHTGACGQAIVCTRGCSLVGWYQPPQ